MTKISNLIKDQPMSAEESVVYWTEYVIRHNGAKHLQSPAVEMPLYQYLLIDVISFILIVIFVIVVLSCYLLRFTFVKKNIIHYSSQMKKKL